MRRLWVGKILAVFDEVDVLIRPADDVAGLKAGGGTPSSRPSSGSKTNVWNPTGAPAIAVPTGISGAEGMSLSMQSAAAPGNEAEALPVAHALQLATGFHRPCAPRSDHADPRTGRRRRRVRGRRDRHGTLGR